MKKFLNLCLGTMLLLMVLTSCKNNSQVEVTNNNNITNESSEVSDIAETEERSTSAEKEVKIIYTNDVHTYINNQKKLDDGSTEELLTYGKLAKLKEDLNNQNDNVILVDAGDEIQGTAFGALDEGHDMSNILNIVGYDVATFGNHEFDYGMDRFNELVENSSYPYVSCNFYSVEDQSLVLSPYEIIEKNGVKIGFIGISTPETITTAKPNTFQNDKGEFLYGFFGGDKGKELYDCVQNTIDEIKDKVDYVVALAHLGIAESSSPWTSKEIIENTTGLNALIDGHSHNVVLKEIVKDKNGKDVILTQTGSYLQNIGIMTLKDGNIDTELISEYTNSNEEVDDLTKQLVKKINTQLGEELAINDIYFCMQDKQKNNVQMQRYKETNTGDLLTDSIYHHFNDVENIDCDFAVLNGGDIRSDIEKGSFTYETAKTLQPFGTEVCLIKTTGKNILDMLEWSSRFVGKTGENDIPVTFGGFLQVSGLKFSVDTSIESTIQGQDEFEGSPTGEYRVKDVQVYNKQLQKYENLDLEKEYTMGGISFILISAGNGYGMLKNSTIIKDYVGEDYMIVSEYIKSFNIENDGKAHISTKNSPLNKYKDFLLNYEDENGAGRMSIILE